jgi:hypothetical protein
MRNNNNSKILQNLHSHSEGSIRINIADLDRIIANTFNPALQSEGRAVVPWNRDSLLNIIN